MFDLLRAQNFLLLRADIVIQDIVFLDTVRISVVQTGQLLGAQIMVELINIS